MVKGGAIVLSAVLMTACARFPTEPMQPGEAMILTKPISGQFNYDGKRIEVRYETRSYTGYGNGYTSSIDRARSADYIPAEGGRTSYNCKVDGFDVVGATVATELKAGACYAPFLAYISPPTNSQSIAIDYTMVMERRAYVPYSGYRCGIELKQVDCQWLRTEAKSASLGFNTKPQMVE